MSRSSETSNLQRTNSKQLLLPPQDPEQTYSTMDQLMDKVGGQGLYQWYAFMVFNAHWFVLGWFLLGIGFYFEAKPFDCKAVGVDLDEAACQEFVCTLPEGDWKHFLPNPPNTMAYEWPEYWMVCSNEYIKSILQSLIALGSCIGFFIFPYYADNKGRKITMVVAWGFFTVGVVFTALANGPWMAGIGQFLMGFGGNAAITLDFSFINEQCSGKARQYFSIGVQMFFAISECLVGYVLYWMQNWRYTVYIMLGATVLVNISHYFLIETPKYMMSKDLPKTVELFNRIAKINRRPEVTYDEVLEVYEKEQVVSGGTTSLIMLFKFASLRAKTLSMGVLFLGLQIIYYCTILSLDSLGFESYENQMAIGLSEALSYLAAEFTIPYLPRKMFSFIGMASSGGFCAAIAILTIITQQQDILELVFLFLMRFILCMYWAVLYVYLAELYPTKVRSLAFGWAGAMGTVGSFAAPYIILIADKADLNRWIIPAAAGLIATIGVFPLPETKGKPLQEEIYEKKKSTILKNTLKSNLM